MSTEVRRVDPLTVGDPLKRLFVENDRPEFPEWFDRSYPLAVRDGASSWVSVDADDRIVAHVAGFPATASVRGQDVRGALLCNLMADKQHRTFFPVVAAVKRAVKDLVKDGAEFVYTNPINPGSVAVMRAAGLKEIGTQNRFLYPLGHEFFAMDAAFAAHVYLRRILHWRVTAEEVDVSDAVSWTVRERCEVSPVTTRRSPDVYFMRWGPLDTGKFIGLTLRDRQKRDVGAAIVAIEDADGPSLVTLRCRTLDLVPSGAAAIAALLRRAGLRRLDATALQETPFAKALQRGGFIQRHDPWTIVAAGYTEAGRQVAEGLGSSDLEKIDVD